MARRGLRQRLTQSIEELDQARLGAHYSELDCTPIAEAPLRQPVRIGGEIQAVTVVPRAESPSLEVALKDGSGTSAVGIFLGRPRVGGLAAGRSALFEGVLQRDGPRLVMLNPSYQLLA